MQTGERALTYALLNNEVGLGLMTLASLHIRARSHTIVNSFIAHKRTGRRLHQNKPIRIRTIQLPSHSIFSPNPFYNLALEVETIDRLDSKIKKKNTGFKV